MMLPLRISDATRTLAESQDEYHALTIRDEEVDGINNMTSLWEPTPRELSELIAGGSVALSIQGTAHPPVSVYVHPMAEDEGYRPQRHKDMTATALQNATELATVAALLIDAIKGARGFMQADRKNWAEGITVRGKLSGHPEDQATREIIANIDAWILAADDLIGDAQKITHRCRSR